MARVAPAPEVRYRLRYVTAPSPALEVSITTASAPAGPTTFELVEGFANVRDPWSAVRDVAASDAAGHPLEVTHPNPRTWRVTGSPGHAVTLRYTMFSTKPPSFTDRHRSVVGPHLIHFVGSLGLMRPTELSPGAHSIELTWAGLETAHLRPATSYGSAQTLAVQDSFDHFLESIFIASDDLRLTSWPVGDGTLELAVVGTWPFADQALADAIARVMTVERAFFRDRGPPSFFVSLLPLDGGAGSYGGTGYTHSFDLALAPGSELDDRVRGALAHEHFHTWNGLVIAPEAFEELTFWFTEGFTNFYAARLSYRGGMCSLEDYVREINAEIAGYASSAVRTAPNVRTSGFWDDPALRKLPYARGHLIALVADREIRRATNNARSLDDVMRVLVDTGRKGATITSERVLAMLAGLTSPDVGARLRATALDGAPLALDRALFEPCLSGETVHAWTYDLGFDWPASLATKVVTGVRPGSPAARAGLRDGDTFGGYSVNPGQPDELVELKVGPTRRKVTYLPRGPQVDLVQFKVHDASACPAVLGPPIPSGPHDQPAP